MDWWLWGELPGTQGGSVWVHCNGPSKCQWHLYTTMHIYMELCIWWYSIPVGWAGHQMTNRILVSLVYKCTAEKEAYAVVYCLKKLWAYLLGSEFAVDTDYILSTPMPLDKRDGEHLDPVTGSTTGQVWCMNQILARKKQCTIWYAVSRYESGDIWCKWSMGHVGGWVIGRSLPSIRKQWPQ